MKPQIIFRNCLTFILPLAVSVVAANAYADVVVIVSAKNSVPKLTVEQTARIFLGKTDVFPNDSPALPIDQVEGSLIRNEFYSKVARKNSSQLIAYWAKIIFTGEGRPPQLLEGNMAVKNAVANNMNAIGYIDKSVVDSSVKVILEP